MRIFSSHETNLHTHTAYCNHAKGSVQEYVVEAKTTGRLSALGFTEHMPVPGDFLKENMRISSLDAYVRDVRECATDTDGLLILLGGECDYFPSLRGYYEDEFLGTYSFDYLTCSIHHYRDDITGELQYVSRSKDFTAYLSRYVSTYIDALTSGLFLFGCHPDLFLAPIRDWNAELKAASIDIIQCAIALDIPLEVNGSGLRKPLIETTQGPRHPYATEEFFLLAADLGAKICCNSDAHSPSLVYGRETDGFANECIAFSEKNHIRYVDWQIDGQGRISSTYNLTPERE